VTTARGLARGNGGFTLFELLAAVFLTALVIGVAVTFYVRLSDASAVAAEQMRDGRRAAAILDRVARDLEGAYLVRKPEEVDPLDHPWVFLAEGRLGSGSDRLKFVTRSHRPRGSDQPTSDFLMVAYETREAEDGTLELWRWTSPRLPESLDRTFPTPEDPASQLLAEGLSSFSVRFLDESAEWVETWDSSLILESGELPVAAEIEMALASEEPADGDAFAEEDGGRLYARRVLIPVRPLDLAALIRGEEGAPSGEGGEVDSDGDGVPDEPDQGAGGSPQSAAGTRAGASASRIANQLRACVEKNRRALGRRVYKSLLALPDAELSRYAQILDHPVCQ
jgi:type II secretory pathway component PulJ